MDEKVVHCSLVVPIIRSGKRESNLAVLLAKGKVGVSQGFYNGAGGKIEEGDDSMQACAVRELEEEFGIITLEKHLLHRGTVWFFWPEGCPQVGFADARIIAVHLYLVRNWQGTPQEGLAFEKPECFREENIPYHEMMEGDTLWLPEILKGYVISGEIVYNSEKKVLRSCIYGDA